MFIFRTLIVCHKAWIGIFVIGGLNVQGCFIHYLNFQVFLHFFFEVILLFSFPNFSMILTFVIFNWLRIVCSFIWPIIVVEIPNVDMKRINNEHFLCLFVECQKVLSVVILLLLHPMCLVKFLLEILCVFLKSVCDFYFVHSIQIIDISIIKFLVNLSFFGKLLLCLVDHL